MVVGANLVVVHYRYGRLLKGTAYDFAPNRDLFHVQTDEAGGGRSVAVRVADLKAVFFVRDLAGNPKYIESKDFRPAEPGLRVRALFLDGEELAGTTTGFQPDRQGFFLIPADPLSNNERIFVVVAALERLWLGNEVEESARETLYAAVA